MLPLSLSLSLFRRRRCRLSSKTSASLCLLSTRKRKTRNSPPPSLVPTPRHPTTPNHNRTPWEEEARRRTGALLGTSPTPGRTRGSRLVSFFFPSSFFVFQIFRKKKALALTLTLPLFFPPSSHPFLQPSPARCAEISRAQQQQQQVGGNQQHGRSSLPASSSGRNAAAAAVDPSAAAAGCSSSSSLLPFLPPRPAVDPIDAGDVGDTLACVDYVQDIMESLYDSEVRVCDFGEGESG